MTKLSIIIPSRNEPHLTATIDNIFAQARGEVEVVAIIEDAATCMPPDWDKVQARHSNLHTILHTEAKGMRPAINAGAASAISRGAKYLAKFDAHCAFGEGFDLTLAADCDADWIVVPRRLRLDPDTFAPRTDGRPPIDYHYLSFPDNVNDFGGPGLNGKVWDARQRERADILLDEELSSQGSGWFCHASYFQFLELMDHGSYGKFWSEFQEIGFKCWLSGGR
jgi:glycosyltransferase involved in cell wall biosynthesis